MATTPKQLEFLKKPPVDTSEITRKLLEADKARAQAILSRLQISCVVSMQVSTVEIICKK